MPLRFFKSAAVYSRLLFSEVLMHSLRGSVLTMGALALLSSTSLWMFISSSFGGHDIHRAAAYTTSTTSDVVLVGIDQTGYDEFFGGRSPLNRERLAEFFQALEEGAEQAHSFVVDLDLTPIPGGAPDAVDDYFMQRAQGPRWLLADPTLLDAQHTTDAHKQWRARWCSAGVRFAYPYLPTTFGQVQASHQFYGAFADQSTRHNVSCDDRAAQHATLPTIDGLVQLQRFESPMAPAFMRDGTVIPFQGDTELLKSMLQALQPQVVMVGGMWGPDDVFLTPFGERYGVHLHAAAIAGKLQGIRIAPEWVQLIAAWLAVAALSQLLAVLYHPLHDWAAPWANGNPGHHFLLQRAWPIAMMVLTLAGLLLVSEASAWVFAHYSLWVPTAVIATAVVSSLLFVWHWGLNDVVLMRDSQKAFHDIVIAPIVRDWHAICEAAVQFVRGNPAAHTLAPAASAAPDAVAAMSRPRALMEFFLALASLGTQTVLPLLSFVIAMA